MEDYKEKYEMALEKAKKFIEENPLVQNLNTWIKETFPELRESEDEKIRQELIAIIQGCDKGCYVTISPTKIEKYTAWLEKQGEKKSNWSEEDEKEYKYVLKFVDNILNNCGNKKDYEHCKRCYDWLKSLRPQNRWKPSDEQMWALDAARHSNSFNVRILDTLFHDLKKLKE